MNVEAWKTGACHPAERGPRGWLPAGSRPSGALGGCWAPPALPPGPSGPLPLPRGSALRLAMQGQAPAAPGASRPLRHVFCLLSSLSSTAFSSSLGFS